jgi:hypothetical protein
VSDRLLLRDPTTHSFVELTTERAAAVREGRWPV